MAAGSVSRYDADKGFGFVTPDEGGPDLFVHVSALRGARTLVPGQRVDFVAAPGKKGMQATEVRVVGEAGAAPVGDLLHGTVSWFDDERGFGFLLPDGGGADVFVHVSEVTSGGTLVPGQPVQFEVIAGKRGPQARQVFALSGGGSARPVAQRRPQGTMSWFNADKGFGFLVPDDGAGEVFVHVSQIAEDGAFIDEGERVEFDVADGERGRQARAVRRIGGQAPVAATRRHSRAGSFGRAQGTVAWFNADKGFGFLTPDDGAGDVFVHFSSIVDAGFRTLQEGQRVDFEIVPGERGRTAEDVRPG